MNPTLQKMKIASVNVRKIRTITKINYISNFITNNNIDIIGIQECNNKELNILSNTCIP